MEIQSKFVDRYIVFGHAKMYDLRGLYIKMQEQISNMSGYIDHYLTCYAVVNNSSSRAELSYTCVKFKAPHPMNDQQDNSYFAAMDTLEKIHSMVSDLDSSHYCSDEQIEEYATNVLTLSNDTPIDFQPSFMIYCFEQDLPHFLEKSHTIIFIRHGRKSWSALFAMDDKDAFKKNYVLVQDLISRCFLHTHVRFGSRKLVELLRTLTIAQPTNVLVSTRCELMEDHQAMRYLIESLRSLTEEIEKFIRSFARLLALLQNSHQ